MEIGLVYASDDPKQTKTRDFVRKFIKEHGILARIVESEQPVKTARISINGCCLNESSGKRKPKVLSFKQIARALEQNVWSI